MGAFGWHETTVLIQSAQKPYAALPLPQWSFILQNFIKISQLVSEKFKFKSVLKLVN